MLELAILSYTGDSPPCEVADARTQRDHARHSSTLYSTELNYRIDSALTRKCAVPSPEL